MARVKIQITTPSNNVIKVSPGVSALSSVQLYLNELIDVNTQHGADGYVLTQQADGTFAMEAVATTLADLSDTDISNPQGGDSLVYDANAQKWVPGGVKSVNGQEGDVIISIPSPPPTPGVDGLADTNITNLQDDQIIRYDSASGNWLNEDLEALPAGGTTGQALVKSSNTDYDVAWDDIAVDVQFHQRYATEAETLRSGATETVELYFFAQGDGNGLAESASSDTPTSGFDIQRKLYYAEKAQADPDTSGDWTQFTAIADNTTFANAKAALLAYLKERTGGTVPISLKMTWEEVAQAPAFVGLLNESYGSGAEAAYSTRRLNGNYSGDCMTIRRASDGTTQSIGFVGEEIDESAIETFCTGTTCTVQVWRDQSGNGNDATQTTAANQPTIYTGGQLVKEGGRLAVEFDGVNDAMYAGLISSSTEVSISAVHKNAHKANYDPIIGVGNNDGYALTTKTNKYNLFYRTVADQFTTNETHLNNTQSLIFAYTKSATSQILHLNGVEIQNITPATMIAPTTSTAIGTYDNATQNRDKFAGQIQEIILWASDKSTDRTDIEGNISDYFQSAKLLDEQFGEGAEAAYSTRQLRRDQTDCMVIRRASDSTTTTIGFVDGDIDESAITTFCTGTTCTVYQWLDQSGNGNTATAAAPANEPTIYTGGQLVKENGKVAVEFSNDTFTLDSSITTNALCVFSMHVDGSNQYFPLRQGTTNYVWFHTSYGQLRALMGGTFAIDSYSSKGTMGLRTFIKKGTSGNEALNYVDGFNITTAGYDTLDTETGTFTTLGAYTGKSQEVIVYTSDKSSDRTSIESNIGDYFTQNTPLLDTYSGAAAAYSLRLLDSTYTGALINVWNGTSFADIGANVFGELDTVALAAHCGSNDGFIRYWYDQSGNGNTATQTTIASMPKIYNGTTGVVTENGKPAVEFDGSDDGLATSNISQSFTYASLFVAYKSTSTSQQNIVRYRPNGVLATRDGWSYEQGASAQYGGNTFIEAAGNAVGAVFTNEGGAPTTSQHLLSMLFEQSQVLAYENGTLDATLNTVRAGTAPIGTASVNDEFWLGRNNDSNNRELDGKMQEVIIYHSDQSANRTGIENNINTFYSIY